MFHVKGSANRKILPNRSSNCNSFTRGVLLYIEVSVARPCAIPFCCLIISEGYQPHASPNWQQSRETNLLCSSLPRTGLRQAEATSQAEHQRAWRYWHCADSQPSRPLSSPLLSRLCRPFLGLCALEIVPTNL